MGTRIPMVRRVTGTDLHTLMESELLSPLGLADTHLGLPRRLGNRRVPVTAAASSGLDGRLRAAIFSSGAVRRALIPAATMVASMTFRCWSPSHHSGVALPTS
jgi:CubicO group peptidase (beta-lactamase class C family)